MLAVGIEIGGTKLQAGVGGPRGRLLGLARARVDAGAGAPGIRAALPGLVDRALAAAALDAARVSGVGVGFGGPVDRARGHVLVSHQIAGWSGFPLAPWLAERLGKPVTVQNDAKTAALAEARLGAGRGARRIFYMTVGSGIGGGLVTDGRVDEGQGLGAAEIGHSYVPHPETGAPEELELVASGWSIGRRAADAVARGARSILPRAPSAEAVHAAAEAGDALALRILDEATTALAVAIANVVALLCPERVIIGGGVSLMGPRFWEPLRAKVARLGFAPFSGRTEILPAALGEEVVVRGGVLLGLGAGAGAGEPPALATSARAWPGQPPHGGVGRGLVPRRR
jgi:glucokinase